MAAEILISVPFVRAVADTDLATFKEFRDGEVMIGPTCEGAEGTLFAATSRICIPADENDSSRLRCTIGGESKGFQKTEPRLRYRRPGCDREGRIERSLISAVVYRQASFSGRIDDVLSDMFDAKRVLLWLRSEEKHGIRTVGSVADDIGFELRD